MGSLPEETRRLATLALHAGQVPDPTTTARAVPIYATTSYVFHDTEHAANLFGLREFGNIYSRLMNPTNDVLEKRLAALDGGAAGLVFASGQAAITAALLTIVHAGQNFISASSLYGGTWTLFSQTFAKLGIEVRFFDPRKPETIEQTGGQEHAGGLPGNVGQPEKRRARLPASRRHRPSPRAAGHHRQHDDDARAVPPDRARFRHRGLFDDEVHRRPRGTHRRGDCRQRQVCLGERAGEMAGIHRARSHPITAWFSKRRCGRSATSPIFSISAPTGCAIRAVARVRLPRS